jgi:hypothetical protein
MGFIVRSRLRKDPVGSYPAFSPLPRTILASVRPAECPTNGQNGAGRFIFCDTFRDPDVTHGPLVFTRHAALWCSDFPLAEHSSCQRSPATSARVPQVAVRRQGSADGSRLRPPGVAKSRRPKYHRVPASVWTTPQAGKEPARRICVPPLTEL